MNDCSVNRVKGTHAQVERQGGTGPSRCYDPAGAVADHRVIQHVHRVLCERSREIAEGLDLGWVGVQRDLAEAPRADDELTLYVGLYRLSDVPELASIRVSERVGGAAPSADGSVAVQAPPRFLHLYFIVFVESAELERGEALLGALVQGFHEQPVLAFVPPGAEGLAPAERISVASVDDLAFGDACILLRAFDRRPRPYLCLRAFVRIDQPLERVPAVRGVRTTLRARGSG